MATSINRILGRVNCQTQARESHARAIQEKFFENLRNHVHVQYGNFGSAKTPVHAYLEYLLSNQVTKNRYATSVKHVTSAPMLNSAASFS